MKTSTSELQAIQETEFSNEPQDCGLTFLNMTGDITITWDASNEEKIKALVKKKMAEGYTFFTMRKVIIEAIQIKRKVGPKGVDSLKSIIIDDATFDKMIKDLDDPDLADILRNDVGHLGKRNSKAKVFDTIKRAESAEEVLKGKQALGVRKVTGG